MTGSGSGRSYLDLIRDRRFGPFLAAGLLSNIGNWFHVVTSVIVVFDLTGSAFMVGLISFANFAAFLVLTPLAGTTTDRFRRRNVLAGAQLASVLVAVVLAAVFLAGRGSTAAVLVASLLLGVGSVFSIPATLSIVPELVHHDDHGSAITLNTMAINSARMIGPVLGATVLAAAGPGAAFGVNAITFLVFGVVAIRLPVGPTMAVLDAAGRRYRLALTLVWRTPALRRSFFAVAVVGVLLEPNTTLTAPLAAAAGASSDLVGWLVGAFGAGALLGAWPSRRAGVSPARLASAGFATAAAGLSMVVLLARPVGLLVGFAALGAGYLVAISALTTDIQQSVPGEVRGRVMALWSQVLLGVRPITSVGLGALADNTSVRTSVAVVLVLAVVGCGLTWPRRAQP